ncbi:MAG: oxygenase MpaB family protein [Chloroflexota bacterium]|nr:oxygenase MpaB family protein [Chloroflexota bacterium]
MTMPTDYLDGYEQARAVNPELAEKYVAHTVIGDPEADAMMEELATIDADAGFRFLQAGMDEEHDVLRDAPATVQAFFQGIENPPEWVDLESFGAGVRLFHKNSKLLLAGMLGGVLVEGFSTNISKSFFITGRLRDQGVRRLQQNNRQMIELFFPGGMMRQGDGWKLSVRVRLVHAQVRRLLAQSSDWEHDAWGVPLSAAHVGFAITAFSARLLRHMRSLGARYNEEEARSFMQIWRYSGHLMGIPDAILFTNEEDALELFRIGLLCEPEPSIESVVLANSLVNSAPLVAGITSSEERRSLSGYVYHVSRALIGKDLADQLNYPEPGLFATSFGVLAWFRLNEKYDTLMRRLFPNRARDSDFANFSALFDVSNYDEEGISYRLPTHVYAEESKRW